MIVQPSAAPRHPARDQPGTEGIWTFVFIDMIVFSLIFLVFLSEKWRVPAVFNAGYVHLDFKFGLANTLVLLTSSLFMAKAVEAARHADGARVRARLALCMGCGALFGLNKVIEYQAKIAAGLNPATDSFFSFYYFVTGAHFLHVLGGLVFVGHCFARARSDAGNPDYLRKLENTGLFWHFVDLLWLFIFPLFYLAGLTR
ncbi:MAG: cytochrome c oxidase subunit 3 [Pseudomonadota bacterium]